MDILNPPRCYIDYCCYIHGLSGPELVAAQERFYKKNQDSKTEICQFINWLNSARQEWRLPFESREIYEGDKKKHGHVCRLMISEIEYWIEGEQIKQRKIYMADQGQLQDFSIMEKKDIQQEEDEVPF